MSKILLVEDNPDNADLVCALLEDQHEVYACESAADAISYLEQNTDRQPDLLLLDISLPGMDGVALLRHLRADDRFSHLPAVALTAHAMKDDRNRLLAVGFDEYISKPIEEQILFDVVGGFGLND